MSCKHTYDPNSKAYKHKKQTQLKRLKTKNAAINKNTIKNLQSISLINKMFTIHPNFNDIASLCADNPR